MSNFKVLAAILCEDIRREDTGQAILIGATNRGPVVSPASETKFGKMSFYVEAEVVGIEKIYVRFRSNETDDIVLAEEAEFPFKDGLPKEDVTQARVFLQLAITVKDVVFRGAGIYSLESSTDNQDWELIREYFLPAESDQAEYA